jgi:hypothetical protein
MPVLPMLLVVEMKAVIAIQHDPVAFVIAHSILYLFVAEQRHPDIVRGLHSEQIV